LNTFGKKRSKNLNVGQDIEGIRNQLRVAVIEAQWHVYRVHWKMCLVLQG